MSFIRVFPPDLMAAAGTLQSTGGIPAVDAGGASSGSPELSAALADFSRAMTGALEGLAHQTGSLGRNLAAAATGFEKLDVESLPSPGDGWGPH